MCFEGTFLPGTGRARLGWIIVAGLTGAWMVAGAEPAAALGSTNSVPAALTAPATPSLLGPFIRMLGALALVLGLLWGVQWFFRQQQRALVAKGGARLNVLEVKSLGQRQALYVVGYEQQRLLVASSPQGISLLTQLPDATGDAAAVPLGTPVVSFSDALLQVIGRR